MEPVGLTSPETNLWLDQLDAIERATGGLAEVVGCSRPARLVIKLGQLPEDRVEPLLDWMLARGGVWEDDRATYRDGGSAGSFSLRLRTPSVDLYCGHYFSLRPVLTAPFSAALRRHPEFGKIAA